MGADTPQYRHCLMQVTLKRAQPTLPAVMWGSKASPRCPGCLHRLEVGLARPEDKQPSQDSGCLSLRVSSPYWGRKRTSGHWSIAVKVRITLSGYPLPFLGNSLRVLGGKSNRGPSPKFFISSYPQYLQDLYPRHFTKNLLTTAIWAFSLPSSYKKRWGGGRLTPRPLEIL